MKGKKCERKREWKKVKGGENLYQSKDNMRERRGRSVNERQKCKWKTKKETNWLQQAVNIRER